MIRDRPAMHLAGLILARAIGRALGHPEGAARLGALRGRILIDADGMRTTLVVTDSGVTLSRGEEGKPDAWLRAPLGTLLGVAAGSSLLKALVFGGLRAGGSLRLLLRFSAALRLATAPGRTAPAGGGAAGRSTAQPMGR